MRRMRSRNDYVFTFKHSAIIGHCTLHTIIEGGYRTCNITYMISRQAHVECTSRVNYLISISSLCLIDNGRWIRKIDRCDKHYFFFKLYNEFNVLDKDELQKRKTSQNFNIFLSFQKFKDE